MKNGVISKTVKSKSTWTVTESTSYSLHSAQLVSLSLPWKSICYLESTCSFDAFPTALYSSSPFFR
jgi:hypothetical protein